MGNMMSNSGHTSLQNDSRLKNIVNNTEIRDSTLKISGAFGTLIGYPGKKSIRKWRLHVRMQQT